MSSLTQYLFTLEEPYALTRSLGEIVLCRDADGRVQYSVGNAAIVFRILHNGAVKALRCYRRTMSRLRMIYGKELLEEELFLFTSNEQGVWVDVVLTDWIEGIDLRTAIDRAGRNHDQAQLALLSEGFDRLAAALLADDWAHGDLKPENIILTPQGGLQLIDRDGCFLPSMRGMLAIEVGTPSYQHPTRSEADFDERIDDYPAALIATALHALQLDPTLYDRFGARDGLLFTPRTIGSDAAYQEAMAVLRKANHPAWIAMGEMLTAPTLRLPHLAALFAACNLRSTGKIGSSDQFGFDF